MDDKTNEHIERAIEEALSGNHVRWESLRERYGLAVANLVARALQEAGLSVEDLPRRRGRVGPLRLLGELGRGGMACVYLAEVCHPVAHLEPGERLAVKILHPWLASKEPVVTHFRREAALGAKLQIDGLARCFHHEIWQTSVGAEHCLLVDHVTGIPLARLHPDSDTKNARLVLHVARSVCATLERLHEHGIAHGDVKPENLIVRADGSIVLIDLGVASSGEDKAVEYFLGSPRHSAPEILAGAARPTPQSDQYSLGSTLLWLAGGTLAGLRPPALADGIARMLEEDDHDRFPNMRACGEALASVQDEHEHQAFVGRFDELVQLELQLMQAEAQTTHVIVVSGEGGIGKSALCTEFVAKQGDLDLIRHTARQGSRNSMADVLASIEASHLERVSVAPEYEDVDWSALVDGALRDLAGERPLLLWVDDADLMDAPFLRFVARMQLHPLARGAVVVLSGRFAERDASLAIEKTLTPSLHLRLGRLEAHEAQALVERTALPRLLSESTTREVVRVAAGLPLAITTMLREDQLWADLELGQDGTYGIAPSGALEARSAPLDVQLKRERKALSEGARSLLDLCACAGGSLPLEVAQAITNATDEDVLSRLEQTRGLLIAESGQLAFAHDLFVDATTRAMDARTRTKLSAVLLAHGREGNWASSYGLCLLACGARDLAEVSAQVLPHLRQLVEAHRHLDVERLSEEALERGPDLPATLELEILRVRARSLVELSRGEATVLCCRRHLALAIQLGLPSVEGEGRLGLARALIRLHRVDEAAPEVIRAYRIYRGLGDRQGEAKTQSAWSSILYYRQRFRLADQAARRGVRLAGVLGSPAQHAEALCDRAVALWQQERFSEAVRLFTQVVQMSSGKMTMPHMLSIGHLGAHDLERGDVVGASNRLSESVTIGRALGVPFMVTRARIRLNMVSLAEARHSEALPAFRVGLAESIRTGDRFAEVLIRNLIGEIFLDEGRSLEARYQLERGIAVADEIGASARASWNHLDLARLELMESELDIALSHFEKCCVVHRELDRPVSLLKDYAAWVVALLEYGHEALACEVLAAVVPRILPLSEFQQDVQVCEFELLVALLLGHSADRALHRVRSRPASIPTARRWRLLYYAWRLTGEDALKTRAHEALSTVLAHRITKDLDTVLRERPLMRTVWAWGTQEDGERSGPRNES